MNQPGFTKKKKKKKKTFISKLIKNHLRKTWHKIKVPRYTISLFVICLNKNTVIVPDCWLFVVLGLTPFETIFQSISGRLPKRGRKKREVIDERKNVQTTPSRTYYKRSRPLPHYYPN